MDGAIPAREAEPGTLKTTLAETPSVILLFDVYTIKYTNYIVVVWPLLEVNLLISEILKNDFLSYRSINLNFF